MSRAAIALSERAAWFAGGCQGTPPVSMLLDDWRERLDAGRGFTVTWGDDRARALLVHVAELEAEAARLREVIAFNRAEADRERATHRAEVRELRRQLAEVLPE